MLLTAVGANIGIRRGIPTLWGVALGFGIMIFVLTLAVSQTAALIDQFFVVIQIIGAAFLLWLAFQIATAPVGQRTPDETSRNMQMKSAGLVKAALFQWVNPKAWLVCAAAISANLQGEATLLAQAMTFSAIFVAAAIVGCFPWLAFGSLFGKLLQAPRAETIFNWAMALLLIGSMLPIIMNMLDR